MALVGGYQPGMRQTVTAVAVAAAVVLAGAPADLASARTGTAPSTPAAMHVAKKPVEFSGGRARNAKLSIPAVGIRRLQVVAYRGKTDDGPGTRIQNRGIAASPYGPHGGIGPGGIGNYQITAHRTSHGGVFRHTPSLDKGDKVFIDAGPWRYVYKIIKTRWVSFRSAKSLREQRAPVPGKPGRKPHRGYLTLSTCATPEDHAVGNFWHDRFGNPEHRIDKIGLLVRRLPNPYVERPG